MRIYFLPFRSDERLDYAFDGQAVIVTCAHGDDVRTETFDFAGLPDGVADEIGAGALHIVPILKAEKHDGELILHLRLTRERFAPEEVLEPDNPYSVEDALRLLAERNAYVPPPIDQGFGEEDEDD